MTKQTVSFTIKNSVLTDEQRCRIKYPHQVAHTLGLSDTNYIDAWEIKETATHVMGSTKLATFDFLEFLRLIGVPDEQVEVVFLVVE